MLVIELVVLSYLAGVVLYLFTLSLAGWIKKDKPKALLSEYTARIAVLIPAYKEDYIIIHTLQNALKQDYPQEYYQVVVIADSLKAETLKAIRCLPVTLIEVSFEQSTKVKALNAALKALPDQYDIAVILDADNLMKSDFLTQICTTYRQGHPVIQGRRVAKNKNTSFAILDAASEIINNHIFRKGYNAVGMSASLIGSGMAFEYGLLKDSLRGMTAIGGFDRELCLHLLKQGYWIKYDEEALVYDEKVEHIQTFAKQRRRWLSSQFFYLTKNFRTALRQAVKGNIAYFEAAVISNLILPRVLILGLLVLLCSLSFLLKAYVAIGPVWWMALLLLYVATLLLPIPLNFYNKRLLKAVLQIPQAFIVLFISLFKLKNSNREFIHTPHNVLLSDSELENM